MYRVAYALGSRAEYGRIKKYLELMQKDKEIKLEILITGAALSDKYGNCAETIKKDGFEVKYEVKIDVEKTENTTITDNMSVILKKFGEYFSKEKYDLLIVLGDRYEILPIVISAAMNKIQILHLYGGEITAGNYDEFIRHSITKMSTYHFTSTDTYRKRVIQLGEIPENVYNIGAIGCEDCLELEEKNKETKKYFVVLYHPETLTNIDIEKSTNEILKAIEKYIKEYEFIFIGTNADTGANEIRKQILKFIEKEKNTKYYENLVTKEYLSLVKNAIALIGNSSSGIIETPSLGTYTINIGDRQKGREKGKSIIDVKCNHQEIEQAIEQVIKSPKEHKFENPYYKENSNLEAYKRTKEILSKTPKIKEFYDIKF